MAWGFLYSRLNKHENTNSLSPQELTVGKKKKRTYRGDFPGGPVVKNPPFNAGNLGWIPGLGTKIPHALGQLSL